MLSSVLPASKKTARITSLSLPGPGARHPPGYTSRVYARVLALSCAVAVLTLAAGLAALAAQTATLEGRAAAALEPAALARVLGETQSGHVWLVRQSLLLLLAAFLAVRWDVERGIDWRAARGEAALLGAAALVLVGASGHAAAVEPGTARALGVDGVHLLAAVVWVGALPPLLLLLRAAGREAGADARPHAVLAARRFSRAALVCVLALVLTGTLNAATQVATVAGLVGTTYGRLLLVKLALLLPLLAVVAVMSATPPARHEAPDWPFAFRLTTASLDDAPALRARALVGSQMAVLGLVGLLVALFVGAGRLALAGGALVVLAAGAGLALPALAVDAYPTTYLRPAVPYQALSITTGAGLYRTHCASCHGATGAGDGPEGRRLPRPPADLRASHTAQHTAGDLFWWISQGIPRSQMPAFGERLTVAERWDLVNFLRALSSGHAARSFGAAAALERPWLVAPDASFAVGPTPPHALTEYRGRRIVLLVLYALPASRPRVTQLAQNYDILATLGVEVIAVPVDAAADALRALGAEPRILFPVVTDGAAEIAAAYGLFAAAPHTEFLIDRQGYLRAIARSRGEAGELNPLLAAIQQLNEEKSPPSAPEEH